MVATGFIFLGLLVGILSGLSSSPVASSLLAALFTFAGGSAAHLLERRPAERRLIGTVVACFAGACLIGLCSGIVIKENRLFTFRNGITVTEETPYLKNDQVSAINAIHIKYADKEITADEAYRQLRAEVEKLGVK